jgi:hypothetical protein
MARCLQRVINTKSWSALVAGILIGFSLAMLCPRWTTSPHLLDCGFPIGIPSTGQVERPGWQAPGAGDQVAAAVAVHGQNSATQAALAAIGLHQRHRLAQQQLPSQRQALEYPAAKAGRIPRILHHVFIPAATNDLARCATALLIVWQAHHSYSLISCYLLLQPPFVRRHKPCMPCSAALDLWPQHVRWVEACKFHYSPSAGWEYR